MINLFTIRLRQSILLLFTISSLLITNPVFGQNWEPVSEGVNKGVTSFTKDESSNKLFIGGIFKTADGQTMNGITQWDGTSFGSLGTGLDFCNPSSCQSVNAMIFHENQLFSQIKTPSVSGIEVNGIASWDGTNWNALGQGLMETSSGLPGGASTMVIYQDNLVVGGSFDLAGQETAYSLAGWDGSEWYSLGFPKDENSTFPILLHGSEVFQDNLYVGGNFELFLPSEPLTTDIARYDGSEWYSVGGGIKGAISFVWDLLVYKDELYVCGVFYASEGNAGTGIMKLKDDEWVDVGGSFSNENSICRDMVIYNEELYVVGIFDHVGDGVRADNIAKWDGERWCGLGGEFNNVISAGEVFNNEIYLGGGFETIDQDSFSNIVRWVGGQDVDTCGNIISGHIDLLKPITHLKIHPNPVAAQATITFESLHSTEVNIVLRDIYGRVNLSYSTVVQKGINYESIDLVDLTAGVYFLTVHDMNGISITKEVMVLPE